MNIPLAPAGPAQPMSYRQGVVQEWNPVTLENIVVVGTTAMVNLPVLGVAEAASLVRGSVIGIMCVGTTWAIIGRMVVPGTDAAADAISLLSSKTKSQTIVTQETRSLFAWGDLATVGPEVTVDIGASGRALLILSAKGGWSLAGATVYQGAFMSAELSGANTVAPNLPWAAWIETQHTGTTTSTVSTTIASTYTFDGLTPGATTFTAKYGVGNNGLVADFSRRTLTVIAL